jgi:hypothetical protein
LLGSFSIALSFAFQAGARLVSQPPTPGTPPAATTGTGDAASTTCGPGFVIALLLKVPVTGNPELWMRNVTVDIFVKKQFYVTGITFVGVC